MSDETIQNKAKSGICYPTLIFSHPTILNPLVLSESITIVHGVRPMIEKVLTELLHIGISLYNSPKDFLRFVKTINVRRLLTLFWSKFARGLDLRKLSKNEIVFCWFNDSVNCLTY